MKLKEQWERIIDLSKSLIELALIKRQEYIRSNTKAKEAVFKDFERDVKDKVRIVTNELSELHVNNSVQNQLLNYLNECLGNNLLVDNLYQNSATKIVENIFSKHDLENVLVLKQEPSRGDIVCSLKRGPEIVLDHDFLYEIQRNEKEALHMVTAYKYLKVA